MIVAANRPNKTMNQHQHTLEQMHTSLSACLRGELPMAQLTAQWRSAAATLPLPERYGQVLGDQLDRIEAGALFSEESCSFSQKDLLASLQLWADKAGEKLNS